MTEKEIAARIYLKSGDVNDPVELLLEVLSLAESANKASVLETYKTLKSGELVATHVITSVELTNEQKSQLEKKVAAKFSEKNLVFVFSVDKQVKHGIEIKVGDDLVDFNFTSKLAK